MKLLSRLKTPATLGKIAALAFFAAFYGVGSLVAQEPTVESSFKKNEAPKEATAPTPAERAATEALMREQASNCIVDPSALEDMKLKREEMVNRTREIEERDAELAAREKALNEELAKLQEIRAQITAQEQINSKQNEEKVAKLVETLEAMSGKAAAQLISTMDETLAVAAITRLSTPKLAKIMNTMEAGRSSRLVETMAGVVRARKSESASSGAAATTRAPSQAAGSEKGGTKNDGKNQ
jgi:flagellar motility protein MotE (MotC chaperone)